MKDEKKSSKSNNKTDREVYLEKLVSMDEKDIDNDPSIPIGTKSYVRWKKSSGSRAPKKI